MAPLPGRTLPAYLVAFSGGIQVEMSVSPSFVWRGNQGNGSFINVSAAHPPREVPLVWHLLSPGRAKHPWEGGTKVSVSLSKPHTCIKMLTFRKSYSESNPVPFSCGENGRKQDHCLSEKHTHPLEIHIIS